MRGSKKAAALGRAALGCGPVSTATLWMAVVSVAGGCSTGLPTIDTRRLGKVEMAASPTCNWYGSAINLKTHWGEQDVLAYVSVLLPDNWQQPGDATWHVKAQNAQGRPIPFLGVLRRYRNEDGTESVMIVPPPEKKLPDCLYLLIDPNITIEGGKIKSIRPVAILREVRKGAFTPSREKIQLIPDRDSEVAPMPDRPATPTSLE